MVSPPFSVQTYIEVHESRLSEFISEHYGRPWRMQQGLMLGQDTYMILDVDAGEEVDGWCNMDQTPEQLVQEWLDLPLNPEGKPEWHWKMDFERDHYIDAALLMNDLCKKGIVEPGRYLITIWW